MSKVYCKITPLLSVHIMDVYEEYLTIPIVVEFMDFSNQRSKLAISINQLQYMKEGVGWCIVEHHIRRYHPMTVTEDVWLDARWCWTYIVGELNKRGYNIDE